MVLDMIDSVTGNILHSRDISILALQEQALGLLQLLPQHQPLPPLYLLKRAECVLPLKAHGNVSHQMHALQSQVKEDVVLQVLNG